ncbi:MAG TPA: hypothetical protein VFR37_01875 [Longimicrobium sp.]|nr:hypothetical protein [Longimicrobium sp.]
MRNGNGEARPCVCRWTWTALGIAAALAAAMPGAAAAQDEFDGPRINYTLYGGAAVDGYETNIQILGATVRPSGNGLRPMAGLQAYRLGFEDATGGTEVFAVNPSVGGGYFTPDGQVSAMVGYSFVNEDVPVPVFGGGGGESGLTTSVQGLYWGASPDVEAIAAYSWEPEYLWTNLVVAQPVMGMGNGTLSLGVDGVYEEQMIENGSSAYSVGPLVRWSNDLNLGVTLAGGYRKAEDRESTWYVRLGAAFYQ